MYVFLHLVGFKAIPEQVLFEAGPADYDYFLFAEMQTAGIGPVKIKNPFDMDGSKGGIVENIFLKSSYPDGVSGGKPQKKHPGCKEPGCFPKSFFP
jgi:hypothetical protein